MEEEKKSELLENEEKTEEHKEIEEEKKEENSEPSPQKEKKGELISDEEKNEEIIEHAEEPKTLNELISDDVPKTEPVHSEEPPKNEEPPKEEEKPKEEPPKVEEVKIDPPKNEEPPKEEHKEEPLIDEEPEEKPKEENQINVDVNIPKAEPVIEVANDEPAQVQKIKVDNTETVNQIFSNIEIKEPDITISTSKSDNTSHKKQITQFHPEQNVHEEEGKNIIYTDKREIQYMSLNLIVSSILSSQNGKYNNIEIDKFIQYFSYQKPALLSTDAFLDIVTFVYDSLNKDAAITLLNQYITNHFVNEIQNDQGLTNKLIQFYSKIPSDSSIKFYNTTTTPKKIISLLKDSDKLKSYYTLMDMSGQKILIYKVPSPDAVIPQIIGNNFDIFNWSPIEIARQMSLMTHHLFKSIEPKEVLNCSWTKQNKDQVSPNVTKVISRFNLLSFWICEEILAYDHAHTRSKVIEKFIAVADELQKIRNYNDCFNVITAFNYLPIKRLTKTWNRVSPDALATLRRLSELCSLTRNWENLRNEYNAYKSLEDSEKDTGCIPYLGYFLKDLAFIDEGPKYFNESDLINVEKVIKVGKVIEELKYFQRFGYNYQPCFSLSFLAQPSPLDEDQLVNESKKLEPKFTLIRSKTNNKRMTKTDETVSKNDKASWNWIFNEYIVQKSKMNSIFLTMKELLAIKKKSQKR